MAITPSTYQQNVFEWIKTGTGNAVVKARAGSGKTTLLVESLALMKGRVLFCAFNKHIADELIRQLAVRGVPNVDVKTLHAFGNSTVRRGLGNFALNERKYLDLFKERVDTSVYYDKSFRAATMKLTDLSRMTLTEWRDHKAMEQLVDRYDIDANGNLTSILRLVPELLDDGMEITASLDYGDMIWFPHVHKLAVQRYDWICVDEAQDLSRAQRELVLKAGRAGRVLAVGDEFQSLYGFAGADTQSIPQFIETLDAEELPLSICYRCPTSHIDEAKKIVPDIEARPDAPEGEITTISYDEAIKCFEERDMVICRINAPLAKIALSMIRAGKKAMVRGRDIGKGLVNLLEKHAVGETFEEALASLSAYRDAECLRLERMEKEEKADSLRDRVDTILTLADGLKDMKSLSVRIEAIFQDERAGVVCSSIHRAKGLQADRVFIYRPELFEYFLSRTRNADSRQQERNIHYVALTRSKDKLFLVKRGADDLDAHKGANR